MNKTFENDKVVIYTFSDGREFEYNKEERIVLLRTYISVIEFTMDEFIEMTKVLAYGL